MQCIQTECRNIITDTKLISHLFHFNKICIKNNIYSCQNHNELTCIFKVCFLLFMKYNSFSFLCDFFALFSSSIFSTLRIFLQHQENLNHFLLRIFYILFSSLVYIQRYILFVLFFLNSPFFFLSCSKNRDDQPLLNTPCN